LWAFFEGGFWEKWVFERGFMLVETWWFGGETWCIGCVFLEDENCANF
jgi:hypothetical protein